MNVLIISAGTNTKFSREDKTDAELSGKMRFFLSTNPITMHENITSIGERVAKNVVNKKSGPFSIYPNYILPLNAQKSSCFLILCE